MTTTEQIIFEIIAADIQARPAQVAAAVGLLDDGCTVPFVARYRKEVTGGLDDTQLRLLEERLGYLRELEKRREVILGSIRDQGKLTPELEAKIVAADTKQGLEDLYLPYRPKRRTLAAIAREAGLEPLALKLFENPGLDPETEAVAFVSPEKNVPDVKAALNGACDILAEKMSEDSVLLADMRAWLWNEGAMTSRVVEGMEETGAKFRDYFDYRELIARMPSHRALAAFRGQAEGVLTLGLEVDAERPDQPVERTAAYFNVGTQRRPADAWLWQCCRWTWRVKLRASLEAEVFDRLREAAEGAAIALPIGLARPSTSSAPICAICFLRRLQATSACLGLTPAFARASRRLRSTRRASCLRRRLYSRSAPMSVVRMRLQRLHDSSASTGSRLSQSATARQAARRSSSSRRSSVFIRGLTSRTWS